MVGRFSGNRNQYNNQICWNPWNWANKLSKRWRTWSTGQTQWYFLIFSLKRWNVEFNTERCYVYFKDVNFLSSLAFPTCPNIFLDITQPLSIKNLHVFYTGSPKASQTVTVVCRTLLEVISKKLPQKCVASWFGWWSTCSSRLLIRHGFVEIRHLQTWAYWQEISCCSYTYWDFWFPVSISRDFWLPVSIFLHVHQLELYCAPDDHVWWSVCVSHSPCKNTTSTFAKKHLGLFSLQFHPARI